MIADGLPQLGDGALDERLHLPSAGAAADVVKKVAENAAAVGRVAHLGVELQTEHGPRAMANGCDRAGFRRGERYELAVGGFDLIAVAHPHDGLGRHTGEAAVALLNAHLSSAELAAARLLDLAAQRLAGELHAVADAEDGNAEGEDGRIAVRGTGVVDARRPAGEDDAARGQRAHAL